jgi:threonine dehydratase
MIGLEQIREASSAVAPFVEHTPLRNSFYFSEISGFDVSMKLENWQPTGSFKVRGAINFLHGLSPEERLQGVVAWSAGNHGLGVAHACSIFETPATIFVPQKTPRAKVQRLERYPVELRVGGTYEECERLGRAYAKQEGATIVHPYDDWRTVAGQGTIGLEILEELPEVDAIVVPVGGGGMISGVAIAAKSMDPDIKIVAVQSANSPSLQKSLEDHVCYEEFPVEHSIAEGIAGGIGKIVYELASKYIDEILNVPEDDIKLAIAKLVENEQMIAEASGAASIAALQKIECVPRGSRVVAIISGGNLDVKMLRQILA